MITFGASVTAQKNGYSSLISNQNYGYGGYHLRGGGVAFLNHIDFSDSVGEIALIDWFSTGDLSFDENLSLAIDAVVSRLEMEGMVPVCLIFPHRKFDVRSDYVDLCKKYFQDMNVQYIDVEKEVYKLGVDLDSILRDDVHTNSKGAELYAEIIRENIGGVNKNTSSKCVSNRFNEIRSLDVNRVIKNKMTLSGDFEIVGVNLEVGPHSGLVSIDDGLTNFEVNTYDRWCYFYREHINFSGLKTKGELKFDISGLLNVKEIYYLGVLELSYLDEFSKLKYNSVKLLKSFKAYSIKLIKTLNKK